ncbi:hypothetical protein PHISCL_06323 [Aspergillus sclerotialis]|uniref:Uncharacterized protein n=1 Tax=Aspergillus sclerotialis TaxID=2070753 RepID=A0A3A2ZDW4_9EURO|nr:hypothetical protein PHISCL_06323 [Aspergillus sclerotialis]
MSLFCCFTPRYKSQRPSPSIQRNIERESTTPRDHISASLTHQSLSNDDDDGYTPIVPLPRYTPRPTSVQEKTLEAHMRDPPISSSDYPTISEEKRRNEYPHPQEYPPRPDDEVTSDDVSSAFSFQSSYGNTSTATRETPPPPYSPRDSPVPSRRMSASSSLNFNSGTGLTRPEMAYVAQPRPVYRGNGPWVRDFGVDSVRGSFEEQAMTERRLSRESR